ncbi:helix-turn-helix transcriptional regulator [Sphingopyxis indica]|uniref:helix-turn-helix transcriptional regulator n=1 Tax=Sphingopyxis indica TaxID=436663 RepID=UPI0029394CA1|nr:helix-turn-helix transcriptional regulator [Sphingopyxis indica]WOF44549.1 helix-turn-helix transcriptional regulator [Sphingopyxis indica]
MDDSGSSSPQDEILWSRLTQKQRDCLELLLERKTSKQISRILGISKDTVDQRITAARRVLGTADRNEAAITYTRLKQTYDRVVYDPAVLAPSPVSVPSQFSDGDPAKDAKKDGTLPTDAHLGESPSRDFWRPDLQAETRVTLIVSILLAIVILVLAGLGIGQALSQLNSG